MHTAKRAELVKRKVELANLAKTDSGQSQNAQRGQRDFDNATAAKTGKSPRSVRQNGDGQAQGSPIRRRDRRSLYRVARLREQSEPLLPRKLFRHAVGVRAKV